MPVDFRYHIISLIAVFCALAIGVLVGFSMGTSPGLEERVDALYALFNEKIEVLTHDVQMRDQFIGAAMPWVLRDRLAGRRVAIVVARLTGDKKKGTKPIEALRDAIGNAGGQVSSVVYAEPRFYRLAKPHYERTRADVARVLAVDASDLEAVPRLVAERLVQNLVWGTERPRGLADTGIIRLIPPYTGGADSLVLVGGLQNDDDAPLEMVDLPIIAECQLLRPTVRVIACEMSDAPVSAIARYKQAKAAATVDNIDTVYGRAAVVLALQSRENEGHFGTKDTAESLLPPLRAAGSAARP